MPNLVQMSTLDVTGLQKHLRPTLYPANWAKWKSTKRPPKTTCQRQDTNSLVEYDLIDCQDICDQEMKKYT